MAVDVFLKLDGIDGESRRRGHEDEIDVLSYSFGVSQASSATGGGASTGRTDVSELNVLVPLSVATPVLLLYGAQGRRIPEAVLTVATVGGNTPPLDFWVLRLSEVVVTSVHEAGSSGADGRPTDAVSLRFARIEWAYTPQTDGGAAGAPVTGGWDTTTGAP